jgi:Amt family ammonium transporter
LLASTAANPAGSDGLLYGNPSLLGIQFLAVLVTIVYTFAVSYVLLKIVDKIFGLRVERDDERSGLDLTQHKEAAYNL